MSASSMSSYKKDGTRGASAHTVSEEYRIELTRLLMNLRETPDDGGVENSITLPPDLTNTQRKFVHELSKRLGLKSKSYGKGEDRKVVVSKVIAGGGLGGLGLPRSAGGNDDDGGSTRKEKEDGSLPTQEEYKQVPCIDVGRGGEEALRKHMAKFPPTPKEEAESRETGSSMILEYNDEIAVHSNTVPRGAGGGVGNGDDEEYDLAVADPVRPERDDVNDSDRRAATADQRRRQRHRQQQHERTMKRRILNHEQARQRMISHPQYSQMMKQRSSLPAFAYANDICDVLRDGSRNQVVILTGDTGCGYVIVTLLRHPDPLS
jgi:hypothetical protein